MATAEVEALNVMEENVEDIGADKDADKDETPKNSTNGKDAASETTESSSTESHYACEELMDAKLQYFWASHIQPWRQDKQMLMTVAVHMFGILKSLITSVFPMFATVLFTYGIDCFYGSLPPSLELYRYLISGSVLFMFFVFGMYQVYSQLPILTNCMDHLHQLLKTEMEYSQRISKMMSEASAYEYKDCQEKEKDEEKIEPCDDDDVEMVKGEPSQACGDIVSDEKDKDV